MAEGGPKSLGEARADRAGLSGPLPPSGLPAIAIILALAALGVGLFLFLEGRRETPHKTAGQEMATGAPLSAAPALQIPPPPPPPLPAPPAAPPPPRIQYVERPGPPPAPIIKYIDRPAPAPPPPPPPQLLGRQTEPPLVVDLGEATPSPAAQGDEAAARATVLKHRALLVAQGTLIAAVLETPIDSTRPGLVRAITSADTRGFDGSRVLIPRGSRLVGDYRSDIQSGQKRVVVIWNRLVRPDGVAIRLTSPASDPLGGAGIAGDVNNHYLARFGSVVLQSALTIGTNLASNPGNGSVVVQSPASGLSNVGQTLVPTTDLKPTITVQEGAAITVFVARDLDFSGALP